VSYIFNNLTISIINLSSNDVQHVSILANN